MSVETSSPSRSGVLDRSAWPTDCSVLESVGERIRVLRIVVNPAKLRFPGRQVGGLSHSGGLAGS
ncbi:hypothetical protein ABZ863_24910 [Saccharomonospora sp. NPDC046836]|uniref:hypothetical protein n=1 Tax=Saccharomonospora sp. NPDC046836 TaxID=3156921 RepID=UPI0033FE5F5A